MKKCLSLLALQFIMLCAFAQLQVKETLCDGRVNPIGIDHTAPEFSWQMSSALRSVMQAAYELRVAASLTDLNKNSSLLWSSGKVSTDQSVHVPYAGPALQSSKKYYWQVKLWDNKGNSSAWSTVAFFQTAFLNPGDWKAKWIEAGYVEDSINRPSPLLRKSFVAAKAVQSATLSITAHGLYEAFINGQRIGEAYLTPGFTSYHKRLQYQVYDVTKHMVAGKNAVGVALGSGWYRGNLAWTNNNGIYGKRIALLYQLDITYADGTTAQIVSDDSWKSATGAIRSSEIYHGETIDARLEKEGWKTASYNDASWSNVKLVPFDNKNLVATENEPVTKHEIFKPVRIFKTPLGEQVIDFGQNLVGFVQVKVKGKSGDSIVIRHAEVLDKAGNFYTANLREAKQTNTYFFKGSGEESFEPHFTFQGFRYIKIDGFKGEILPDNFTAVALYSDMRPTGSFSCSNPLINQLQHNIQWGQKGNFLDVPTDCPQRDERLGWTGDAQVFARTAAYNMGVDNFFRKWMKDVAADQLANGSVPFVVPNVLGDGATGSTGWADVATIIPWTMYQAYGDKRILSDQYNSMKAWVNFMTAQSNNHLWNSGFHFGDWLFYRPDDDNDGRAAVTDKYLIAQCFYAYSTQLLINAATVLNKTDDVKKYNDLLQSIKTAFVNEYMTANGRLVSGTQTAYVLALNFDMLPEELRASAAQKLAANVKDYGYHLTTGFLGTPYLCHVLSRFGFGDVAYTLLMQETYPSWLYPVKQGATTIWERWDGQKPDGSFQAVTMNSFNHYAYGAIGDWMYRVLAGINTDTVATGYKKIIIKPFVTGKILNGDDKSPARKMSHVSAAYNSGYGKIASDWKFENGLLIMTVDIPANTTATVYLPHDNINNIKEGNTTLSSGKQFTIRPAQAGFTVVEIGSGNYVFSMPE